MSYVNRILVVDDEASVCSSIDKILSRQGHQVVIAYSADEALRKIEQEPYQLVLADLMMPQVNGMELLKKIRAQLPNLNVVMITGYASINSAVEATRLGAFDYLPKPFTPEELTDITDRALNLRMLEPIQAAAPAAETTSQIEKKIHKIDVDLPFDEQEVMAQTSPEYVAALTRSDIPVSHTYCKLGQRDCKKYKKQGTCEDVCPIVVREQKLAAEGKLPPKKKTVWLADTVKHPVDVDLPFDELELTEATSEDYVQCLSRSDIPILGLNRFSVPALTQRVLVVDDEAVVCNSVRKILAMKGLLVDQAFDAIDAMRKIEVNKYGMVILDLKIPKMDGIQLLRAIKIKHPDIVAVMITGYASIATAVQATRFGAFEYLPKPFTPDELISVTTRGLEYEATQSKLQVASR